MGNNIRKQRTIQDIRNYLLDNNYRTEVVSNEYINNSSNLEFKCGECGDIFTRTFKEVMHSNKEPLCIECSKNRTKIIGIPFTYEYVKEYIEHKSDSGCELISESYKNCDSHIFIKCSCGEIFKTTFYKFSKRGKRQCNKCSFHIPTSHTRSKIEDIAKSVEEISNCNFVRCDEYNNNSSKMVITCENCGEEFETIIANFLNRWGRKTKCDSCSKSVSSYEARITDWLTLNNIGFITEFGFDECRYKKKLLFDFYIKSLNMCIEYDGEQHYMPVTFGGVSKQVAYKNYIDTVKRDTIKNNHCKNNNIRLIRIPYWEKYNIENILNKEVNCNVNT